MTAKKVRSLQRQADIKARIVKKQDQLRKSLASFRHRFPAPTQEQLSIVALDFDELSEGLQSGHLSALQVVEAYIAKALQVRKVEITKSMTVVLA